MSIFNRIPILSGLVDRRRNLVERLSKILSELDQAERAVRTIEQLETTLPAELKRLRGRDICPVIPAISDPDRSYGEDIAGNFDELMQNAKAIRALEKLEADLPRLKRHWTERRAALRQSAAATGEDHALPAVPSAAPTLQQEPAIESLEGITTARVLELVEEGKLTAARALELERATKRPRPSLMAQLRPDAAA